jgi:hypothetical protein
MGVPLGFTPLHAVKKEPELPAVNETTDKPTLRDEMKIVNNEVHICLPCVFH